MDPLDRGTLVKVTLRGTYEEPFERYPDTVFVRVRDEDDDSFLVRVPSSEVEVIVPEVQPGQMYRKNNSTYVVTRTIPLSHGGVLRVTNVLTGEHSTVDHLIGAKLIADHEDLI